MLLAILLIGAGAVAQETVDTSRLPRAADRRVDFATDIRPLLRRSCLKCHGDKEPKSDYRLTSRELALKGGELGVAILSGDSANSPFAQFIAGLVEDMEMPPEGKAPALSREEISLVCGWIDQGAAWPDSTEVTYSAVPMIRWITIDGSEEAFRQHWGMTEGHSIGLGQVTATGQTKGGSHAEFDGRYIGDDEDYLTRLRIDRPGLGYVETGFESWREYGLGTGGYLNGMELSPFRLA
ncbi:MAG TPA: c-type cytochrome domain-containing protein, partial [Verrucomicrobiota bacterium]|nr:c-type cytochrome domain-containing protein [Verrucomicrobiota bacterium]